MSVLAVRLIKALRAEGVGLEAGSSGMKPVLTIKSGREKLTPEQKQALSARGKEIHEILSAHQWLAAYDRRGCRLMEWIPIYEAVGDVGKRDRAMAALDRVIPLYVEAFNRFYNLLGGDAYWEFIS